MPNEPKKTVAETKYLRFIEEGRWSYVERKNVTGIVAVIALTAKDEIILIEQYRMALHAKCLELPAGLVGDEEGKESEPLLEAAQRELLEETGYAAPTWQELFKGPPSAGLSDEIITFYIAKDAVLEGKGGGDGTEDINVHLVPLSQVDSWLKAKHASGLAIDPKVYAGLYFARPHS